MRTREVISRVKKFRDYYGFDIPEAPGLKTKLDCLKALQHHKTWLEGALTEAMRGVDSFIEELGIEWEEQDVPRQKAKKEG